MSKQQIPTVCIQCQKHFLSKKRNTKFCSDICKAQDKRDRDKKLHQSQAKIIQTQAEVLSDALRSVYDYLHNQIVQNEKNGWNWVMIETIRNWSSILFSKSGYVPDTFSTDKYIFTKVDATKYSYKQK